MKTLCLIALLIVCSMAVTMNRPMTNAQINKFESLKQNTDHKWAGIMMNLAELHLQAEGPLDELVDAINEVVADIERKTERAYSEYDRRTNEHTAEVERINGQINSANQDIANTTELLENVLYVQRANLESDIVNLNANIATTQQHILDETVQRENNHEKFLVAVSEHEEALSAVDEALEVLSQLFEGASLIQVKKAQKSIEKVTAKLGNGIESSMVKALLALTSTQFSDSSDVQKVVDLLNEVRNNLIGSIAKFNEEEESASITYSADMATSANAISQMQMEITEQTAALEATNNSIVDNEEFLAQRKRDLSSYQQDLVDENDNFDRITALFEDLVAQLTTESQACSEALNVLQNGDIAGYIGNRMSQDVIIDQPHGSQLTVETNPNDFE